MVKKQHFVVTLSLLILTMLSACDGGVSSQASFTSGWESMRYSEYTAAEPPGLLRMGK